MTPDPTKVKPKQSAGIPAAHPVAHAPAPKATAKPQITADKDNKQPAQKLGTVVGGKNTPKKIGDNIGVGPGHTVMTSDQRIAALSHDAHLERLPGANGKVQYHWAMNGKHDAHPTFRWQGAAPSWAPVRTDGSPSRVAGKPSNKPQIPTPMQHSIHAFWGAEGPPPPPPHFAPNYFKDADELKDK